MSESAQARVIVSQSIMFEERVAMHDCEDLQAMTKGGDCEADRLAAAARTTRTCRTTWDSR